MAAASGIVVDIRFGSAVDVSTGDRAAHDHDVFHQRRDRRIFRNGQRDVRQRPDGNQRDLMRILVHKFDDEIGTETRVSVAFRSRQLDSSQSVLAVPELRRDQLLIQRMLCSARHRQVAAPGKRNDFQRILQTLTPVDISGHNGQRFDFQFGRIQREEDRHRVIDAWIGVNDHSLLCLRISGS